VAYPFLTPTVRSKCFPRQGRGLLAGIRRFQRGPETVLAHGLAHLLDHHGTLLMGDDGLAPLEAHLGLPDSLEPLQGPLDQDRSAPSGHAVDAEVDNDQLLRASRHGPEGQPETRETSKKGPAIHKGPPPSACYPGWHPHCGPALCAAPARSPQQEVG